MTAESIQNNLSEKKQTGDFEIEPIKGTDKKVFERPKLEKYGSILENTFKIESV
jgi:hypothetical protein